LFTIADLQEQQKVLIHAGASGIGTSAIQLAKAKGCYVVVTVSSEEKAQACLALGADVALNYHEIDFVAWTKEHLKAGFNMILDVVAGDYFTRNISICAVDAHIVILSMLGGRFSQPVDFAKMLGKRISLTASTLRNRSHTYKAQLVTDFVNEFYPLLEPGLIHPVIDRVYSWKKANEAHQVMASNANIGKLVLTID
jgi:NADPH2:quinone reductase